jgi:8-oxo-dGTP diphosphatase
MKKGIDFTGLTVSYFCHDKDGNFVMMLRGKNCRDEHGRWDGGGGGVEFGDNIIDRLKTEIKEEYCADILDFEFLGYRDVHRTQNGQPTHWVSLDFKVFVDRDQVKNGEPHKFDDIGWFNLETLPEKIHSQLPGFIKMHRNRLGPEKITTIGFAPELVPFVTDGSKTLTYRLGDKYSHLKVGDIVKLKNSQTGIIVAYAEIIEAVQTTFEQLPIDRAGHEPYESKEAQYETFKRFYSRDIQPADAVVILGYKIIPL